MTYENSVSKLETRQVWLRVLACLALVILTCGLKNYLIVIFSGTALCPYLCSSVLDVDLFFYFPVVEQLFEAQTWGLRKAQTIADWVLIDPWKLTSTLVAAPVVEELIYRGPLYLSRRLAGNPIWWIVGTGLAVLFALSHGRTGLALLPLLVFGICSLWLIMKTGRFWPSIALHFLHNFFFTSTLVYHSMWVSD